MSCFKATFTLNRYTPMAVLAALTLSTPTVMAGTASSTNQRSNTTTSADKRHLNEVIQFHQQTWRSQFGTTYSLGDSFWSLGDGLPSSTGTLVTQNSAGDSYSVTLFSVGDDPATDEIEGLTANEIYTAQLLQFQLIDVDGSSARARRLFYAFHDLHVRLKQELFSVKEERTNDMLVRLGCTTTARKS